ncbi:FtsK/SpoIIIE domain-containing protein [Nonomuraea sp. NPDC003214]
MIISGLGRHIRGRDYLPKLGKVTCTSWADLVTVRMLSGQAVKDWADRTDNLARGFGASSCRIAVTAGGWLQLTFPRNDPLATSLPAVPIPESASVGPIEIGKQEDGQPWLLKAHGTHVLVAGETGAGKGSIIWSAIRGLLPAVRAGLVEIWALDPKLMELSSVARSSAPGTPPTQATARTCSMTRSRSCSAGPLAASRVLDHVGMGSRPLCADHPTYRGYRPFLRVAHRGYRLPRMPPLSRARCTGRLPLPCRWETGSGRGPESRG